MANLLLSVMGAFAEFERALILERQREGIAAAKTRGATRPDGYRPLRVRDTLFGHGIRGPGYTSCRALSRVVLVQTPYGRFRLDMNTRPGFGAGNGRQADRCPGLRPGQVLPSHVFVNGDHAQRVRG